MPVTTPPLIPQPFAESGDRVAIPDTTVSAGRASYDLGFPPITMQPKIAGGIPPDGRDMNGILYALSAHALFLQGGQVFKYDASVSTAIGGYGVGALLESTDGQTLWLNVTSGNTTDPDASGAGWIPITSYGYSYINGLIGGTRTLTRVEARNGTLVLSGALVANQTIILPVDLRSWRIVNLTTGSFTTTINVSGGTGVTAPQGGYSASIGVFGNGTDIFLEVPPVALPIAVTPTADTLAKRDNVGDLFARYFNSSASAEALTVGTVLTTNGVDGYLRKITFANFLQQVSPPPTVNANGTAMRLPNGYVDQFGSVFVGNIPASPTPAVINITFPVAFPTALDNLQVCVRDTTGGVGGLFTPCIVSSNLSSAVVYLNELNSGIQNVTLSWRAVGH